MQQEPRREATENNGTLFSLVRKRLGRDRVLVAKEKNKLRGKITGDEIKHKMKYK